MPLPASQPGVIDAWGWEPRPECSRGRITEVIQSGRTALRRIGRRVLGPATFDELAAARAALGPQPGVLVDVGAHRGGTLEPFAEAGWEVYAIEPDPANLASLTEKFGSHPRVHIDPRAISARDGEHLTLYTSGVSTGISALAPFHPSHEATATVETVRLDTLLQDVPSVTVLKTDLEGWDLIALRTFPWERLHPSIVMAEFEDRKTLPLGYNYGDLGRFLMEQGYEVLTSEWFPVVEYGKRHRWRRIERFPLDLADEAAWGNLIAVEPGLSRSVLSHARAAGRRLRLRRAIRP
jgi:FkbM family methyltransferase